MNTFKRSVQAALQVTLLATSLFAAGCGDSVSVPKSDQPGTAAPGAAPSATPTPAPSTSPSVVPATPVQNGKYGGRNIEADVLATGVNFRFACAEGKIAQPLLVDDSGAFDVEGTFQPTGGPVPQGGHPVYPARYYGTVINGVMELNVSYTTSNGPEQTAHLTATHGQDPVFIVLCALSS